MVVWSENETVFLRKPYYKRGRLSLKVKLCLATYFILSFAVIEHALARVSTFQIYDREAEFCNYTYIDRLKFHAMKDFRHYFTVLPYHPLLAKIIYVS